MNFIKRFFKIGLIISVLTALIIGFQLLISYSISFGAIGIFTLIVLMIGLFAYIDLKVDEHIKRRKKEFDDMIKVDMDKMTKSLDEIFKNATKVKQNDEDRTKTD